MGHWLETVVKLLQADTSDLRELCRIAGGDLSNFYRGMDLRGLDLSDEDLKLFQIGSVSSAIIRIKKAVRQEERIAILLDEILQNRNVGVGALAQYSGERARFANNVVNLLRSRFSSKEDDATNDAFVVASLIKRLYTDVYPYNRGALLYFLAKHLGKYSIVNSAIKQCLNRSASMFVTRVRQQVNQFLESPVRYRANHFDQTEQGAGGREGGITEIEIVLERELDYESKQQTIDLILEQAERFGSVTTSDLSVKRFTEPILADFVVDIFRIALRITADSASIAYVARLIRALSEVKGVQHVEVV